MKNIPKQGADHTTAPMTEQKQPTTIPQPPAENMEVHHHAHHPHGKRNWRSYGWEFVMLFLAVFCGFLAEYQLEHTIEKDREQQYVVSMIADLHEDGEKIKAELNYTLAKFSAMDSFLADMYSFPYTDSSLRRMYYYFRKYTSVAARGELTKRTITQLKYSGGLRLIRNKGASDSIVNYDEMSTRLEMQAVAITSEFQLKAREYGNKVFDAKYLLKYDRNTVDQILQTDIRPELMTTDQAIIKEYANWIYGVNSVIRSFIYQLREHEERRKRLIIFLEKEYDL